VFSCGCLHGLTDGLRACGTALYRKGYLIQSEFVPWHAEEPQQQHETSQQEQAKTASEEALPSRPRFFTPREVARLQGFPESFLIDGPNENRWCRKHFPLPFPRHQETSRDIFDGAGTISAAMPCARVWWPRSPRRCSRR